MELPDDLRIIHEPVRLRILGLLYRETDLGFTALRTALDLTSGNLSSHVVRLEGAGLVVARDALGPDGFERRIQITPDGVRRFRAYLEVLRGFLQGAGP